MPPVVALCDRAIMHSCSDKPVCKILYLSRGYNSQYVNVFERYILNDLYRTMKFTAPNQVQEKNNEFMTLPALKHRALVKSDQADFSFVPARYPFVWIMAWCGSMDVDGNRYLVSRRHCGLTTGAIRVVKAIQAAKIYSSFSDSTILCGWNWPKKSTNRPFLDMISFMTNSGTKVWKPPSNLLAASVDGLSFRGAFHGDDGADLHLKACLSRGIFTR